MSELTREQFIAALEVVDQSSGPLDSLSEPAQIVLSYYDHLRQRVSELERQLQYKDQRITELADERTRYVEMYTAAQQQLQARDREIERLKCCYDIDIHHWKAQLAAREETLALRQVEMVTFIEQLQSRDATITQLEGALARLSKYLPPIIDIKRFEQAPCYLCGYNGQKYYQPKTHPCAQKYQDQQALAQATPASSPTPGPTP
jgi:chromosome segregation ATPase